MNHCLTLILGLLVAVFAAQANDFRVEEDNDYNYRKLKSDTDRLSQSEGLIENLFNSYKEAPVEDEEEHFEELEKLKNSVKHIIHLYRSKTHDDENVCVSPQCVIAAAQLLQNMNHTADPCIDFHEYACGNFAKHHPLPDSETHVLSFQLLAFQVRNDVRSSIEGISKSDTSVFGKMKAFYDTCTDITTIDAAGTAPMVQLLKKIGTFPFQEAEKPSSSYDVNSLLLNVQTFTPAIPFFYIFVDANPFHASQYSLSLAQSGLSMARSYYVSNGIQEKKVLAAYKSYMLSVMSLLGYKSTEVQKMLTDVLEFEKKLAEIYLTKSTLRKTDKVTSTTKLSALRKIITKINIVAVVNKILMHSGIKPVSDHYHITVTGLKSYFPALEKLLAATDEKTLANYIGWKAIVATAPYLSKPFREAQLKFHKVLLGVKTALSRWKVCLSTLSKQFPIAHGMLYTKSHFQRSNIEKVSSIIASIRKEFIANFANVKWMDEKTKAAAREKAHAMLQLIGYPVKYEDTSKLNALYAKYNIIDSDYFNSMIQLIDTTYRTNIRRLLQRTVDRHEWDSTPAIVNAFYSSRSNRIVLPAGILQKTFYSPEYPMSLNYGGIGTVAGHEITHGFDDHGRKFDSKGDMRLWWSADSIKEFETKANCIRNQFSNFQLYNEHVNGNLTSGENIADNGGLKMAYRALKRWEQTHGEESRLPGLHHLTSDQLYFLAYARIWCNTASKEYVIQKMISNEHAPSRYRINGAVQNSDYFSLAYNCPAGSPMNPHKKCVIW